MLFKKNLDESNRKPNIDKQHVLQWINEIIVPKNAIKLYSAHKEEKFVVNERFIKTCI